MDTLAQANKRIDALIRAIESPILPKPGEPVFIGVDVGTANVVTVAVDSRGWPVGGAIERARVVREGMVVDYLSAVSIVNRQAQFLREKLHTEFGPAASAYPPVTEEGNIKVTRNILESADLEVVEMIDEPSAAAMALGIKDGAVVDVGGGTTGVSILRDGSVVYTADEATGGFQFDLVIAGATGVSIEEAERHKRNSKEQKRLFPLVRPVMEKIATIVKRHIRNYPVEAIYLVGGSCSFYGFADHMERETGLPVYLPAQPLYVTPMGIALACVTQPGRR